MEEGIDGNSVELPALLLQPLVENAIKHGVAPLYNKGRIRVQFRKERRNLVASISDNGGGFNPAKHSDGFGLKLTAQRLALLNENDREHLVAMRTETGGEGTTVILDFKNMF